LINFVDATNDANHYTKPPPINDYLVVYRSVVGTVNNTILSSVLAVL